MTCADDEGCARCEAWLQPYLDRELTAAEHSEAELHLERCDYCRKRYVFEERLRKFVRRCCAEPMPAALRQRLDELRLEA